MQITQGSPSNDFTYDPTNTYMVDVDFLLNELFPAQREINESWSDFIDTIESEFHVKSTNNEITWLTNTKVLLETMLKVYCIEFNSEFVSDEMVTEFSKNPLTNDRNVTMELMDILRQINMNNYNLTLDTFGFDFNWQRSLKGKTKEDIEKLFDESWFNLIKTDLASLSKLTTDAINQVKNIPENIQIQMPIVQKRSKQIKELSLKLIELINKTKSSEVDKEITKTMDQLKLQINILKNSIPDELIEYKKGINDKLSLIEKKSEVFIDRFEDWMIIYPTCIFIDAQALTEKLPREIKIMEAFSEINLKKTKTKTNSNNEWIVALIEYLKLIRNSVREVNVKMIYVDEKTITRVGKFVSFDKTKDRNWGHRRFCKILENYWRLYSRHIISKVFQNTLAFDFNGLLRKYEGKVARLTKEESLTIKDFIQQAMDKIKATLPAIKRKADAVSLAFDDSIKTSNRIRLILYEIMDIYESPQSQAQTATLEYYQSCISTEYDIEYFNRMQITKNSNHQKGIDQLKQSIDELCKCKEIRGLPSILEAALKKK